MDKDILILNNITYDCIQMHGSDFVCDTVISKVNEHLREEVGKLKEGQKLRLVLQKVEGE